MNDAKNKLLANDARVKGIQDKVNNSFVTSDQKFAAPGECKDTDGNKEDFHVGRYA